MTTFSNDPHRGMICEKFDGSAVVFVSDRHIQHGIAEVILSFSSRGALGRSAASRGNPICGAAILAFGE
jgi:hypothetical protein